MEYRTMIAIDNNKIIMSDRTIEFNENVLEAVEIDNKLMLQKKLLELQEQHMLVLIRKMVRVELLIFLEDDSR